MSTTKTTIHATTLNKTLPLCQSTRTGVTRFNIHSFKIRLMSSQIQKEDGAGTSQSRQCEQLRGLATGDGGQRDENKKTARETVFAHGQSHLCAVCAQPFGCYGWRAGEAREAELKAVAEKKTLPTWFYCDCEQNLQGDPVDLVYICDDLACREQYYADNEDESDNDDDFNMQFEELWARVGETMRGIGPG